MMDAIRNFFSKLRDRFRRSPPASKGYSKLEKSKEGDAEKWVEMTAIEGGNPLFCSSSGSIENLNFNYKY